jgi:Holliday junction DNA helicase RuvB
MTKTALQKVGIDGQGFDGLDRKYLSALINIYQGGPAGIDAIAASLGEDRQTLEDVVEPYLLTKGFITRSPRGRIATDKSYHHLQTF